MLETTKELKVQGNGQGMNRELNKVWSSIIIEIK